MNSTFKLLFYLRKPKLYNGGPQPIYLRITIDGQRAEISTQRDCDPAIWNGILGRLNGTRESVKLVNAYLDSLVAKVYHCQNELIRNGIEVTAETIKNRYTGKDEKARMLVPIFQKHNDEVAILVPGGDFAKGTLERYKTSLSHTVDFLKWKYKISDIDITKINHEFVADYDFYLRSVRKCANNTTVKYIKNFKKIIKICIANGWLDKDPFVKYKAKVKEVERDKLFDHELEKIIDKKFVSPRLTLVRDIFVFSCYTGLAYADVQKMSKENVVIGIDGEKWLIIDRTKNDNPSRIPLLPVALQMLAKYADDPQCINKNKLLPILSNQKMNSYLKEIADVCEIAKDLTFHIARHTFATTVTLNNDVPIESVSKMLGHKSIRTTQQYAKILDKKVSNDMQILRAKFENKVSVPTIKKAN